MKLYNLHKILFENNSGEEFYFKDEWIPTDKDWETMIMNMNNHSNLDNIFRKTSTFNVDKMVRCYLVAKVLGWPKLERYHETMRRRLKDAGIFYDEFEIIDNQFIDLPEVWKELILDLEQYDKLGGVALRHQDMGELCDDNVLFNAFKYIDKHINTIQFSKISLDRGDFHPNQRIIKINFRNGSIAYIKVVRWSANDHSLKTRDYFDNNIKKSRFSTLFQIYLNRYINEVIIDPTWTPEYL